MTKDSGPEPTEKNGGTFRHVCAAVPVFQDGVCASIPKRASVLEGIGDAVQNRSAMLIANFGKRKTKRTKNRASDSVDRNKNEHSCVSV